MARLEARFPGSAQVFHLRLNAFDFEMDQRPVRKDQLDPAGRRIGFLEADRQQRKNLVDLQDIYLNNQNVGARAVRECIDTILPRWFVEKAQDICHQTLKHGEGKPLQQRIDSLVNAFSELGVSEAQLEARVGRKRGDWTPEDLAQLTVAGTSIKRGEVQRDELFPPIQAETTTADEIAPAAAPEEKPKRTRKTKADKAREDLERDVAAAAQKADAAEQAAAGETSDHPGQDGGSDQSQGAEPSSGATLGADSGDQDPPANPEQPAKTPMRKAVEKRLFTAIGEIKPKIEDDDRIELYRQILGRNEIGSTNDLSDVEVTRVGDVLFQWSQAGELDNKVNDALNTAAIAAENRQQS